MNFSKNDPGYIMWLAHQADAQSIPAESLREGPIATRPRSKHTHRRWEDDNQEGGSIRRYTPGVTKCWQCNEVIDANGDCAGPGDYVNGDPCGGHG